MNIIKNIEVSRKYGVSPTTVANWIESALKHKNNLQIIEIGPKQYILDTANNQLLMEKMTNDGKKHKNLDARRVLTPSPEFYKIFNENQISEIILGLENHKEILHKYTYLDKGAQAWQNYSIRTIEENIINVLSNTKKILNNAASKILENLDENKKINLIDIGPGDVNPIIDILNLFNEKDKINKYIAIDFSPEMLAIAKTEFVSNFGDKIKYQELLGDASISFFQNDLFKFSRSLDSQNTVNVILFVGGTLQNEPDTFETLLNLKSSLSKNDIAIIGYSLNSISGKTYFDFKDNQKIEKQDLPNERTRWIPELLNILPDIYTVKRYYSEIEKSRKTELVLNMDLEIEFNYTGISTTLEFRKGERITLWRHRHHTLEEIIADFDKVGLEIMHTTTSKDMAQIVVMARLCQD